MAVYHGEMARLCERPGCSDPGAIAYGFDGATALVWLALPEPNEDRHRAGVLCLRHADAMVVPIGWTLDDRRDNAPRLFHVSEGANATATATDLADGPVPTKRSRRRRPATSPAPDPDQLQLPDETLPLTGRPGDDDERESPTVAELVGTTGTADPDATVAIPWEPHFDDADDLDGVLDADSPLLARAFRGPGHGDGISRRR